MEPERTVVYVGADAAADVVRGLRDAAESVAVVETAADCLSRLENCSCVVTTATVPDADPVDLCSRIRERRPDVPVVVYPEDGSESLAGAVIAAGADGYVPRSDGVDTLVARVDDLCSDREPTATGSDPDADGPVTADESVLDADVSADASADRLDLLVEQSPLAIIEWNLEFEVCSWNPAATELFGYTADEARGESAFSLLVPDESRDDVRDYWNTILHGDSGERTYRNVNRNVRKDGTPITCEWFNTPLIDEDGEVVSVLSFAQDVTRDRKRANALEELQETTRELMRVESMDQISEIVVDATERVIDDSLAGVRFHDDDTGSLEVAAVTDRLAANSDDRMAIGPDDGPLWDVYEDGEPVVVDDASGELVPYDLRLSVGNAIVHPLGDHGLLTVASSNETELDVVDVHLVHVLAATAEAALDRTARERELERAKTVIETVGDSVYALDPDGRFVTVNDTMAEMTGYDRDELVGAHASKILTEESLERARKRVQTLITADSDSVATYEVTVETRSGERIPCEVNTTLLRSDDTFQGTVGIIRDVSDRKRMKRKLVDRKGKIESLHEIASRLDDCDDRSSVFELAVEAAEDVLNFDVCVADRIEGDYLVTEAVSSSIEDADYFERLPVEDGLAGKTYRNGRTYWVDDATTTVTTPDENETYRSLLSVPIGDHGIFQAVSTERAAFDDDDAELAELLMSHVTDTLDRLSFEAELKEERDRFLALFENVPDAVVSTRLADDGPIVEDVNPAFERIFGYDEQEVVGERLDQRIVPATETTSADTLNRHGLQGDPIEAEVKRRTTDGLRDFMARVVPMDVDGSSERAFGVYTDITEQKQRQKRVEILNRVLRHDLRNGMNIINGCAEMLVEAVDDDDVEYAETIQERAGELISLAEKTRAVERTLERSDAATGPIDVAEAAREAADRIESSYPEVDVTCSVPERTFVRADEFLQTAVFQVLENAVEHNDSANPTVDVTLCDCGDDGMLALSVADNGPGLPDEERELLQEEREITQLRHASGLGLWLVNWVVTQSGGRLTFDANEPRGTVVTLRLPRADVESTQVGTDGAATGD